MDGEAAGWGSGGGEVLCVVLEGYLDGMEGGGSVAIEYKVS